jgi:hypothetical protein
MNDGRDGHSLAKQPSDRGQQNLPCNLGRRDVNTGNSATSLEKSLTFAILVG